jgi:TRAP-type C4-dicarboxylate transport system permease small subunit
MTHLKDPTPLPVPETGRASTPAKRGAFQTCLWAVAHFEEVATALLLAIMIGSIGLSVFCRYVLKMPLSWTEEVVLLCMVWVVFLGASIATKHKEHIIIDIVVSLAPRRLAKGMEVVSLSVIIAVLALLVWQGIRLVEVTQDVETTALGIPTMYIYAAVPVSALLMLIHSSRHLVPLLRHR